MAGLSDDAYIAAQGQFSYGFGIDIRRNARFIQLQRKQLKMFTTTGIVNTFALIDNNDLFAFDSAKNVYWSDGTVVYTAVDQVYETCVFGTNLYMFRSGSASIIPTANCLTTASSWTGITNAILGSNTSQRYAINYLGAKLFFSDGKALSYFDSATPTVRSSTAFSSNSDIVGISLHGDCIWIYCEDGRMYAYDIGNDVTVGTKDFQEGIKIVRPNGDIDLVGTMNSYMCTLWANSGVQPGSQSIIKKARYDETVNQVYGYGNMFSFMQATGGSQNGCNLRSTVRMMAQWGSKYAIYSYGKKGEGFPLAWSIDYVVNADGNQMNLVGAIFKTNGGFYYSWRQSGTSNYGVDYVSTETDTASNGYLTTGEILTLWDDSCLSLQSGAVESDREMRKEISFVKLGAIIPNGCSVSLYYLLDGQAGTGTLYKTWTSSDAVDGSSYRCFDPIATQFSQICWRIVLNSDNTNTGTPRVFDLKYVINPVKES